MTTMVNRINTAADSVRDAEFLADKKRFESFKLGGAPPATQSNSQSRRHSHSRSHSRNVSVSISPSPSFPFSSSSHNLSVSLSSSSSSSSSLSQLGSTSAAGTTKRGSHHRRRSSVSTRRESAEVMGVSLPALSASNSEDNLSLGDKDSIRRRALWALEGKPSADGFSPVEIPELSTPEIERRISELPSKPSFPPTMGSFVSGMSGLANMRDSFSNRPSSSIKDQLHTLVEEEEEEEEEESEVPVSPPTSSAVNAATVPTSPTPTRARPRPTGLNLRPLSLSPDRLLSGVNTELPTPAPTPTPPKPSGLKSLTLTISPSLVSSPPSDTIVSGAPSLHRRSIVVPPTHAASSAQFFRRPSLTDHPSDPFEAPKRRSSISYKPSNHGLPTPELTPTTERRASTGSDGDWGRPSSVSDEQHFLFQSQTALVARISELERALSSRTQSRPASLAVSDTSSGGAEPADEMLHLVADLKAERDELKRDINGWRTRVASLEKQTGELAQRVDSERREAWVARERLGLLETEKRAAVCRAEESAAALLGLQAELTTTKAELRAMQEETVRSKGTVHELDRVTAELAEERRRCVELEKALEALSLFNEPTPVISARRVMSIDSLSSATDVDSLDGHGLTGSELKAVQEVDEDEETYSDHENHLMGYEDEEEGDESFVSHDGSSFGSLEDIPHSTARLVPAVASSPTSVPTHTKRSSLSREWSFPVKGMPHAASQQHMPEEIDRFFGCLEDIGDSPPNSAARPDTTNSNPFSRGFFGAVEDDGDELPPFVLPLDVGTEVESLPSKDSVLSTGSGLGVVLEEEEPEDTLNAGAEDEFIGEEDEGGIKFTFKVPPAFVSPESSQSPSPTTPPPVHNSMPYYEPVSEDDDQTLFPLHIVSPASRTRTSPPSPSSIPRAIVLKRFEGLAKDAKFSPRASPSPPRNSPSSMRGGSRPSFLPQPTTKTMSVPTFIPHPTINASASSNIRALRSSAQSRWQATPGETALRSSSADANASAGSRPFTTLQNLANFVQFPSAFSWSGVRSSSESPSTAEACDNKIEEQKKGFVSKERQLARLRQRMAAEEGVTAEAHTHVQQQQGTVLPCRRCVDRVVSP